MSYFYLSGLLMAYLSIPCEFKRELLLTATLGLFIKINNVLELQWKHSLVHHLLISVINQPKKNLSQYEIKEVA